MLIVDKITLAVWREREMERECLEDIRRISSTSWLVEKLRSLILL